MDLGSSNLNMYRIVGISKRLTIVVYLVLLGGCGGGGSSSSTEPPPVPPVNVSLTAVGGPLSENGDDAVTVNVHLDETVNRTITAQINLSGTATVNVDYEVSSTQVTIPAGQQSSTLQIVPLLDWLEEQSETIEVSLGTLGGNATAIDSPSVSIILNDDGSQRPYDKSQPTSTFLWVSSTLQIGYPIMTLETSIFNLGRKRLISVIYTLAVQTGNNSVFVSIPSADSTIPSIRANGFSQFQYTIDLQQLEPNQSYTYRSYVEAKDDDGQRYSRSRTLAFALDASGRLLARCTPPNRTEMIGLADPLLGQQWNLRNTGQTAYSNGSGNVGEDLGMDQTLDDNSPSGVGVKVAVSDTGLELCHPDLAPNIEAGKSFNFYFVTSSLDSGATWISDLDPFNPETDGDHGTSVAGLIGSVANNGIGGRGVAPSVQIRGYNVLNTQCCFDEALGASTSEPNSSEVDIFNLSYGRFGLSQYLPAESEREVFENGVTGLRDGKGAIYVKAAGNNFNLCSFLRHTSQSQVGCVGSVSDTTNVFPFLVVTAAFSADGERSSYSSVGSNVWITAPSGEFGVNEPAMLTTDQFGFDRGYDVNRQVGVSNNRAVNPDGDYVSTFNGTSAATPNAAGSIALILDAYPELNWREVKHALATSARKIHADIEPYEVVFGNTKVTLRHGWITNSAGYNFHNWYGFGAVAVDAALDFLSQYTLGSLGEFAQSRWFAIANEQLIRSHDGSGSVQNLSVDVGKSTANIEGVQVEVDVSHPFPTEIMIQLTSPEGTESIVNSVYNNTLVGDGFIRMRFLSNAFYGESPNGSWQLKVIDVGEDDVGQLNSWRLRVYYGEHN